MLARLLAIIACAALTQAVEIYYQVQRRAFDRFVVPSIIFDNATTISECKAMCSERDPDQCMAVEFSNVTNECSLFPSLNATVVLRQDASIWARIPNCSPAKSVVSYHPHKRPPFQGVCYDCMKDRQIPNADNSECIDPPANEGPASPNWRERRVHVMHDLAEIAEARRRAMVHRGSIASQSAASASDPNSPGFSPPGSAPAVFSPLGSSPGDYSRFVPDFLLDD